ncbi:MAG: flagellar basal body P-ring formation protein FlgA [Acidobacteriaceae bacterium]|nr:flagellar basal body P-ring formation protein FlgA [Acidobacteriaceae bacterium]
MSLTGAAAPPIGHPEAPVLWRGEVLTNEGESYPIWARVRVLARTTAVRTKSNLKPQQVITDHDIEQVEVTDSPVRLHAPDTTSIYVGKTANRAVAANTYLERSMITPVAEVTRGSIVAVEVINGAMNLKLKARAETAGNTGDTVTLTNPSGLRRFTAVVTGRGTAELVLSPDAAQNSGRGLKP